jgi:chemotaxis protein MotB
MASDQPIVIKKVKKGGGHGHHGGAWKVAYADFVTAMMAFFLMMWLINNTEPEQREGIADYFAPASVSQSTSGSGGVLGGTAFGEGARGSGSSSIVDRLSPPPAETNERVEDTDQTQQSSSQPEVTVDAVASALARRESAEFASAEQSLRQALMDMPELAELSRHVIIEETPEGLRIQLIDEEGRPMFAPGQVQPNERARVSAARRRRNRTDPAEPDHDVRPHRRQPGAAGRTVELGAVIGARKRRAQCLVGHRHSRAPDCGSPRQGGG